MQNLNESIVDGIEITLNDFADIIDEFNWADSKENFIKNNKILSHVSARYGLKVTEALISWVDILAADKKSNWSKDELLELLTTTDTTKQLNILQRTLGGGSTGVTIKLKSGLVLKKLFHDFNKDENAKFYQNCKNINLFVFTSNQMRQRLCY